jgi:hypothetical protein
MVGSGPVLTFIELFTVKTSILKLQQKIDWE